ncbi:DUF1822 family protein [Leptolyngbya sp. FACHB-402]|nr:DUF1822 family protein [Leptolyngbya sp. FACHB-161]MBD2371839.1 DUF1822 family protein [Leptolyngbya sp. FACHB-238]MBD2396264.1 DUF1822 family protein [Leptolyngbya sp. FACHB-239]MBD2402786.1 DUF1822 family protein [Leptolyngbya sp. FACHB-402]
MMIPLNAASTPLDLTSDRINRAIAFSQTLPNSLTRWQSHLALLALEGLAQYFSERSTPIQFDRTQARLLEPSEFGIPAAINSIYADQFHLALFVVDNEIEFPMSLMQNPAHFYIAASVNEEANQIEFYGFLRGDRLNLSSTSDATCLIPVSQLETNFEHLFWYLASLELSAIPLPSSSLAISAQWLIQPLVNAAQWVQTQIDELSWTLFSLELAPAGMRASANAFSADLSSVFTEIERSGLQIPSTAQSGYRSIKLNQHTFRLYITTWAVEEAEWSLLAILESIQSPTLPTGTQLVIQAGETVLVEEEAKARSAYLIAQIIGDWNEQFTLTLKSVDPGDRMTIDSLSLPPIVFQPD